MSVPLERLAGSDTREAASNPTVRLAAFAAALVAGPAWAAALGSSTALEHWLGFPGKFGALWTILMIASGVASAILAWRVRPERHRGRSLFPPGAGPLVIFLSLSLVIAITGDNQLAALSTAILSAAGGWFAGRCARVAASAVVAQVRSAAIGIVTLSAVLAVALAGPLAAVSAGSGFRWGAVWTMFLISWAGIDLIRAHIRLPEDRLRSAARVVTRSSMSTFSCDGITVRFGPTDVLKGADLQTSKGELVALVGGNGAGKSTLLRVAAGLCECQGGHVTVGGHDVTMLRPEERAELGLSFVSGARPIFPDLTVLENLRVAAFHSHIGPRSFHSATDAIFEMVPALNERRGEKAAVLSGGEQRLLAVAQTLYQRPVVLLADELTLGLALEARIAVLDLLRLLADEGVAVVAVDHDLPSLLPRSDRAVLLSEGVAENFENPVKLLDQRAALLPATFLVEVPR